MIIYVEQKHIDLARSKPLLHSMYSTSCPVARAFNDAIPGTVTQVSGAYGTVYHKMGGGMGALMAMIKLPSEAEDFVSSFDGGEDVKPFHFEIEEEFDGSSS